ncbi:MAG: UDP-N-acetylglucosamine 2-epimerase (non-hydrolyzing) [Candidatus Berkelbacteria bacterium]
MPKKKIVYIIGTRPEIIRSATIISLLKEDQEVDFRLVHTGQHYDYSMDKVFFEEFGLPEPDINLSCGSGSHAEQTADIMVKLDKFFQEFNPDIVAVFGDTNSSLAAAITSIKMQIPLAHIEAGCREWEMDMPEEVNRRLIDHCSNVNMTVSKLCSENLLSEHVAGDVIFTGDPLFDVYQRCRKECAHQNIAEKFGIVGGDYALITTHRGKNVDNIESLEGILKAMSHYPSTKFIFPVHPRTKKHLEDLNDFKKKYPNVIMVEPLNYRETINLVVGSKFVITDSGGLQKEVFWSGKPCITIREHTAWVETVDLGVNILVKPEYENMVEKIDYVIANYDEILEKFKTSGDPYSPDGGNITETIIKKLKEYSGKRWSNTTFQK